MHCSGRVTDKAGPHSTWAQCGADASRRLPGISAAKLVPGIRFADTQMDGQAELASLAS